MYSRLIFSHVGGGTIRNHDGYMFTFVSHTDKYEVLQECARSSIARVLQSNGNVYIETVSPIVAYYQGLHRHARMRFTPLDLFKCNLKELCLACQTNHQTVYFARCTMCESMAKGRLADVLAYLSDAPLTVQCTDGYAKIALCDQHS